MTKEQTPAPQPVKIRCFICYKRIKTVTGDEVQNWRTNIITRRYKKEVAHTCSDSCQERLAYVLNGKQGTP